MGNITLQELERRKRYLKRYRKNRALIDRLKDKVEALNGRIYNLRSPVISDMPRGGKGVEVSDLIADREELGRRIEKLERKGKEIKSEILEHIDDLDDPRYAEVLESFFIDCKDFWQIAEEMDYTERHIIRLYSEGILALNICQDPDGNISVN